MYPLIYVETRINKIYNCHVSVHEVKLFKHDDLVSSLTCFLDNHFPLSFVCGSFELNAKLCPLSPSPALKKGQK